MQIIPAPDLLKPIRSDKFLLPIYLWAKLAGLVLVGSVGGAIILVSVIPHKVVIEAPATVRPSGEIHVVQATTAGVVNRIAVQENQKVKQGDAIAYLDDSLSHSQKSQLQGNIRKSQQQLAQISAQIHALNGQQAAVANQRDRLVTSAAADLHRNRREFREKQITTQTELQEADAELELAQEEMKRYRQLANTGAIPLLQIKQKEQALKVAFARRERAKAKINPSDASVTMALEQIAQEQARGSATLAKLHQERESLVGKQVEIENQLNRDRQALQQLERDRQKNAVRATAAGTILKLELRNPGQVVRLGESIATISPSRPSLSIKAQVDAQNVSRVQICKQKRISDCHTGRVQLRISAYPYPDYGTLHGAVVAIAPDAATLQNSPASSSVPYYEVKIQPEKTFLVSGDRTYALQAGMDATADIISKEETVLSFILRKARLLTDL
jgi:HlyD family type I secretion membrane fusion protein